MSRSTWGWPGGLEHGMARAAALKQGLTPWISETGARGYVSKIDGSVQPYVISVPAPYSANPTSATSRKPWRLDVWGHGRDEMLSELRFVEMDDLLHEYKYLNQPVQPDRFILSLYGRYITAFKFAGEIDGLEALSEVERRYPIDQNRLLNIGFSMGGASAWEYAVHYPDLWAAAAPAAGFAETREFLKAFQKEDVSGAPWYQRRLWHLYDCTDYAMNLFNVPTIAYGGELDPQKQASDIMLKATEAAGVHIERVIGKGIGHHYTPEAKQEIDAFVDRAMARGRNPMPDEIRFTTWTLRYNRAFWLTLEGLDHHWQKAEVTGRMRRDAGGKVAGIELTTGNVTALSLSIPAASPGIAAGQSVAVSLDGETIPLTVGGDGSLAGHFSREAGHWKSATAAPAGLRKRHGLQGPIDDAFMDRFIIVRPTGQAFNQKVAARLATECDHAIDQWFQQFRGHAIVKNDTEVTEAELATSNVILFGDPSSNRLLAKMADKLPIVWNREKVVVGSRSFSADHYAPALIYPNPLHPDHYVVLNSGFTYREYDYLNNARQTPKLPDYAIIDLDVPATSQVPGGIEDAGFFDESWGLAADEGKSQQQGH